MSATEFNDLIVRHEAELLKAAGMVVKQMDLLEQIDEEEERDRMQEFVMV